MTEERPSEKPFRGEIEEEVEVRSKWTDMKEHASAIGVGAKDVFKNGTAEAIECSRLTFVGITSFLWLPIFLFWMRGMEKRGVSFKKSSNSWDCEPDKSDLPFLKYTEELEGWKIIMGIEYGIMAFVGFVVLAVWSKG